MRAERSRGACGRPGGPYRRLSRIDVICRMGARISSSATPARIERGSPRGGGARGARLVGVLGPAHPRGPDLAQPHRPGAGSSALRGRGLVGALDPVRVGDRGGGRGQGARDPRPGVPRSCRPPRGFRGIQAADLTGWSPERPSPAFDSFLADLGAVLSGAPVLQGIVRDEVFAPKLAVLSPGSFRMGSPEEENDRGEQRGPPASGDDRIPFRSWPLPSDVRGV